MSLSTASIEFLSHGCSAGVQASITLQMVRSNFFRAPPGAPPR